MLKRDLSPQVNVLQFRSRILFAKGIGPSQITNARKILVGFLFENAVRCNLQPIIIIF